MCSSKSSIGSIGSNCSNRSRCGPYLRLRLLLNNTNPPNTHY